MIDASRFVLTKKSFVNSIEITYDEIRLDDKIFSERDLLIPGTDIVVGKEVYDTGKKQSHYYLNGLKVCSDIKDDFGNNRHIMDLKVLNFTRDDNSVIEITKFNTWIPDTCNLLEIRNGCIATYVFHHLDTMNIYQVDFKPCDAHKNLIKGQEYISILTENQTKNKAMQIAAENDAELAILNDNGGVTPNLEKLSYSYDKNRNLILTSKATFDKSKVQAMLDSELGSGKVSIVQDS